MQCIKCKAEIPEDAVFCPKCGKKQIYQPKKKARRPNGAGTAYRLSGKRSRPWVASKGKVIIGYYETKAAAMEALERMAGKDLSEKYNWTFAEIYQAWQAEHFRDVGQSSIRCYKSAYDIFAPLHNETFRKLRTENFQAIMDSMLGNGYKYNTMEKYKSLLTQLSDYAIREDIIATNYASFVKIPRHENVEKKIFTEDEIARLFACQTEPAMIVCMLLSTGMRIGELFSLPLSDVHERYVVGGEKTEAGRNRIIPIRPEGRPLFAYFEEKSAGMPLLLSGYSGSLNMSYFRKYAYYPLLRSLGIQRLTPHATRHTYASRAVREGMPREVLQKILGHSNYEMTANVYVHSDIDTLIEAVEKC